MKRSRDIHKTEVLVPSWANYQMLTTVTNGEVDLFKIVRYIFCPVYKSSEGIGITLGLVECSCSELIEF